MKKTYHIYCDPRHAWLKVSFAEIKELEIQDKISTFSYLRNDQIYLEEDRDLSIFLKAKLETDNLQRDQLNLVEHYTDRPSRIRNYPRYPNSINWRNEK